MLRAGVLIAAATLLSIELGDASEINELRENIPRKRERLRMGTDVKIYKMTGLKPGSTYELRVSYPATIPAAISFKIIPNAGGAEGALQRSSRRLLNVEKLPFHVELDATIEGIPAGHALVSVSASPAGVRPSAINRPPEEWLIFNIGENGAHVPECP
eukprot:evm.model.scf_847EXC.10 EVM.evm.TU.scf_847EXC.10   scf_847EXC:54126-55400(-)